MKNIKYSETQLENLYQNLLHISDRCCNKDFGNRDKECSIWKTFSFASLSGKQLYNGLSDEKLLKVLRDIAEKLGYSPSQKEVFWVWREFIKLRFKKWPYALEAAGLPVKAGKGGKTLEQAENDRLNLEILLEDVRKKSVELGRIPHPKDLPHVCIEIKKYMDTWAEVISAAGLENNFNSNKVVNKTENVENEYLKLLEQLNDQANALGRAPLHNEISQEMKCKLIRRFGSWRNTLFQIGLEPVMRIKPFSGTYLDKPIIQKFHSNTLYDCYYKVLNLDEKSKKYFEIVRDLAEVLGRVPMKKEIPTEIRQHLQATCGSWSNALFQIGLAFKD